MYACMSVRVRVCVRECVRICVYVNVCVCTWLWECMCACVFIHVCACLWLCMWLLGVCMYHSMYVELRGELFRSRFSPTLFLPQCIFQDSDPGVSSWCSYLCLLPLLPILLWECWDCWCAHQASQVGSEGWSSGSVLLPAEPTPWPSPLYFWSLISCCFFKFLDNTIQIIKRKISI